jgi:hypothetical protein
MARNCCGTRRIWRSPTSPKRTRTCGANTAGGGSCKDRHPVVPSPAGPGTRSGSLAAARVAKSSGPACGHPCRSRPFPGPWLPCSAYRPARAANGPGRRYSSGRNGLPPLPKHTVPDSTTEEFGRGSPTCGSPTSRPSLLRLLGPILAPGGCCPRAIARRSPRPSSARTFTRQNPGRSSCSLCCGPRGLAGGEPAVGGPFRIRRQVSGRTGYLLTPTYVKTPCSQHEKKA